MRRLLILLAFVVLGSVPASAQVWAAGQWSGVTPPIFAAPSSGVTGAGVVTASQILAPDGSASAPSYSFANFPTSGLYAVGATDFRYAIGGSDKIRLLSGTGLVLTAAEQLAWGSSGVTTPDVSLSRGAANRLDLATGDSFRLVSGSLQFGASVSVSNSTGAVTYANSSGLIALGSTQSTDPTCTSNCGTSPTVVGTDSEFTVTMGSSGSPASGFVITFNGTWPSNPQCVGAMAKAGMAVGKLPLTLVTSTTTLTVVTNGTAPATTDIYNFICRAGR